MNEIFIPSSRDENRLFKQVLGHFDAPAYVRRARQVDKMLEALLEHCRGRHEELLKPVRRHLRLLGEIAGGWDALARLLRDAGSLATLRCLHEGKDSRSQALVRSVASRRTLRRAVAEFNNVVERFNRRWKDFLKGLDLGPVNETRTGYNRYYVLEKECAVRSLQVARQGFRPLPPFTHTEVENLFPCLPVLEVKD